ncbi:MAG: NAD(P)-dependent alcohol dehydrogenase [Planctomycetes bacterium]|nr:NAD(P)-dependent alcohol dehydrogenase [Planctomycetota bacterium]
MRAVVYDRYGPPEVLRLVDLPRPAPAANEVLVEVRATTVSAGDVRMRSFDIPSKLFWVLGRLFVGVRRPRKQVLGTELAGVVVEVGAEVKYWKPGDEIVAFPGARMGAYAEYVALPEASALAPKPARLSWGEAAALAFGGTTALYFLRNLAHVKAGERVLVIGASGSVGSAAVQLAKHRKLHVTAVTSGANQALVRELGADEVIDYEREDFAARGECWDVIFDTVGATTFGHACRALAPKGRFLATVMTAREVVQILRTAVTRGRRVLGGVTPEHRADLTLLAQLAEQGHYRPLVDRTYALDDVVEAHRYVDQGRKRGNVVVRVRE